jgi:hypothetical protein
MKTRFITTIALVAFLGSATSSYAASFDFNYTTTSTLFTADSGEKTEWLHLDQTVNQSWNFVNSQFGSGGLYEGYQFATRMEVGNVTSELFGWDWSNPLFGSGWSSAYVGYYNNVVSVLGNTGSSTLFDYARGMTSELVFDGNNWFVQGLLSLHAPSNLLEEALGVIESYSLSSQSQHRGSFLYKTVPSVPIPAAAFMFAPALLGFLGFRRKVKNSIA